MDNLGLAHLILVKLVSESEVPVQSDSEPSVLISNPVIA